MAFYTDQAARSAAARIARLTPTSPSKAMWSGMKFAGAGSVVGAGILAYETATAQRGEMIPTLTGQAAGLVSYPALSGTIAAGGALAAAALGIPPVGVGLFAAAAALYPEVWIANSITRGVRTLNEQGRRLRELEFGAGFKDSPTNQALRSQALYEMSGASSSARRYLGQEAFFMHR